MKEFLIEIILKRIIPLTIILLAIVCCFIFCLLVAIFLFLPIWIPLFIISRMRRNDSELDEKNYDDVVKLFFGFFCIFGSDYLPRERENKEIRGYVEY